MADPRARDAIGVRQVAGQWGLVPAVAITGALTTVGAGYAVASSLGLLGLTDTTTVGIGSYRALVDGSVPDLGRSVLFTLWVSGASTLLAAALAVLALAWLDRASGPRARRSAGLLHATIALPHVVWAVALVGVLSQSGILSRIAAGVGVVDSPEGFPVLIRDPYGLGIILHYASKEAPFLALIGWAMLRSQPPEARAVATTLGARGWRRFTLVTLPTVLPGIAVGAGIVFAFVVGAYEAPSILGVTSPRMASVVGLDLFSSPDLADRPVAMALGVVMALVVALGCVVAALVVGRRRS